MTIKELQVIFNKSCIIFSLVFFFNCQNEGHKNEVLAMAQVDEIKERSVAKSQLILNQNVGLVYYKGKPFTGTSVVNYLNGKKAEIINYTNGIREGVYKKWFEDGLLSFEAYYVNGKLDGVSKSWWFNGNLRSESHYIDGVANGIQKQWYVTGEKFKQMTIVNGKEEGMQKAWRRNGKIYNNYEAKNGRIFGLKRANLCFQLEEEIVQDEKI